MDCRSNQFVTEKFVRITASLDADEGLTR